MNLPDYHFLSAPLSVITILHIVTLGIHFLAMNFVLGGVIIVLFARFDSRFNDTTVQKFVRLFPSIMAFTVTFGVAPLLFLQLVYVHQVYSAAIVSAWYWLLIPVMVIVAYYCFYSVAMAKQLNKGAVLWLAVALLGLLYVSFTYSAIFALAEDPALVKEVYAANQSGWVVNPAVGDYLIRWLHMIFGALTVGAFFFGLIGQKSETAYKMGKNFFGWGMAAAAFFGLAYLLMLGDYLSPLMKSPAIYILLAAIALALLSLHFFFKKHFTLSLIAISVSLLGMVTTRHYLRLIRLEGLFDPATIKVVPQWGIFGIFLGFFVLALLLLAYMLRAFFATPARSK